MVKFIFLLFLIGCNSLGPIDRTNDGDFQAPFIIWNGVYNRTDALPPIYWSNTPECFICSDLACGGIIIGNDCKPGYTLVSPITGWSEVHILYYKRYSSTSLAHELMHARLGRDLPPNEAGDPGHVNPVWQSGIIEYANYILEKMGL